MKRSVGRTEQELRYPLIPVTELERIGGPKGGSEVRVLETQGEWSKLIYGTGYGWVQSKYLEPIPSQVPVNPFVDVFETDQYYEAVLWAYYADPQVTTGMDETHFGPDLTVTRAQAVTFGPWRTASPRATPIRSSLPTTR